jgi:hypothetical protein
MPTFAAASIGDSTTFEGSSFGERSRRSSGVTVGNRQYIIPMPEGNQRRKITQSATPSQRWMKISERLSIDR